MSQMGFPKSGGTFLVVYRGYLRVCRAHMGCRNRV